MFCVEVQKCFLHQRSSRRKLLPIIQRRNANGRMWLRTGPTVVFDLCCLSIAVFFDVLLYFLINHIPIAIARQLVATRSHGPPHVPGSTLSVPNRMTACCSTKQWDLCLGYWLMCFRVRPLLCVMNSDVVGILLHSQTKNGVLERHIAGVGPKGDYHSWVCFCSVPLHPRQPVNHPLCMIFPSTLHVVVAQKEAESPVRRG